MSEAIGHDDWVIVTGEHHRWRRSQLGKVIAIDPTDDDMTYLVFFGYDQGIGAKDYELCTGWFAAKDLMRLK